MVLPLSSAINRLPSFATASPAGVPHTRGDKSPFFDVFPSSGETRDEILIAADRFPIGESHTDNFVSGGLVVRTGAVQGHESVALAAYSAGNCGLS